MPQSRAGAVFVGVRRPRLGVAFRDLGGIVGQGATLHESEGVRLGN